MAKEQEISKKQEEIAKWFMDLAKYIVTGLVIAPMLTSIENMWVMVGVGGVLVISLMLVGVSILSDKTKKKKPKKR